jgi:hypothetical protein
MQTRDAVLVILDEGNGRLVDGRRQMASVKVYARVRDLSRLARNGAFPLGSSS